MTKADIETPALLLDLDVMERNLARMAAFFAQGPTRLRPHYKNHKCPALAKRQLAAGAIGMTCATLAEADELTRIGVQNILLANEIAGPVKVEHFVQLSRTAADIMTLVDNSKVIAELAAASARAGVSLSVVVDVDTGLGRCGVAPGEAALTLAQLARDSGLRFRGVSGYEGHVVRMQPGIEKERAAQAAMRKLVGTRELMEAHGLPVEIVSASGTGTYSISGRYPGVTEIQAGSYVVMDTDYHSVCQDFDLGLSVLATVISRTGSERLVLDLGFKEISAERGLPVLKNLAGAHLRGLNAEHAIVDIIDPSVAVEVGDQVEVWVHYGDATINLHRRMFGLRKDTVEEIFQIANAGHAVVP
jgi:D-serine deaminase-like pyridoxal phosphate-dependent protein